MGELETKTEFVAQTPEYPQSAEDRRQGYETMIRAQQINLLTRLRKKEERLRLQISNVTSDDQPDNQIKAEELDKLEEKLSEVEIKILQTEYDVKADVELPLSEEEKGEWRQQQKAYEERVQKHILNQQKAFAIIIGQCTQRLQDTTHSGRQSTKIKNHWSYTLSLKG